MNIYFFMVFKSKYYYKVTSYTILQIFYRVTIVVGFVAKI